MLVKNFSARGWWVAGELIAPNEEKEVNCTEGDIVDNPDLMAVKKAGRPSKAEKVEADNADAK